MSKNEVAIFAQTSNGLHWLANVPAAEAQAAIDSGDFNTPGTQALFAVPLAGFVFLGDGE